MNRMLTKLVSLGPGDFSSLHLTSMPLITTINESSPVVDPDIDICATENDVGQADMSNSGSTTITISTYQIMDQGVHSGVFPGESEDIHDHNATHEGELALNMLFPSTLLSNVTSQPVEIIIREQIAEGSDFDQERVLIEPKVPSPS